MGDFINKNFSSFDLTFNIALKFPLAFWKQ